MYDKLVSLWNNRRESRSELTAILDVRHIDEMTSSFTSFQVIHARRSANFAAHLCAQSMLLVLCMAAAS